MAGTIRKPCLGAVSRPRQRTQLALEIKPDSDLLARLKAAAAAQRRTVTSLALEWIEAGLDGRIPDPTQQGLTSQLQALADRVAVLEAALQPRQRRAKPAPPATVSDAAGAIETAELAQQLGIARKALNARIQRRGGGRIGLEIDNWRIVGTIALAGGKRWLWKPIA